MFEFLKRLFRKKQRISDQYSDNEPTIQKQEPAYMQEMYKQVETVFEQKPPKQAEITFEQTPCAQTANEQKPTMQTANELKPTTQTTVEQKPHAKADAVVYQEPKLKEESSVGHEVQKKKTVPKAKEIPQTKEIEQLEIIPQTPTSSRKTVTPRVQRNVSNVSGRRIQKNSVYIGLDFGTTFTKAAYEIAPSNVHKKFSIKFGAGDSSSDYYLPSVLYFDPNTSELHIFNNTGNLEEIQYFKYNMISNALQKNKVINDPGIITRTTKEQLCCVFFLSYVISLIRNAVNSSFGQTVINDNTSWYINMGVPLEAHKEDERAFLYKKVLEIAYLFERDYHGRTEINIHEIDDFFEEHKNESNPSMNILPEIYAEVLLYQQYLNTPAGFYTVVDIGGGTEDIATFLKTTDEFGETVECLAQNVIGYGYNSVSEKIVKSINKTSVQKAKAYLNKKIDFNNDANLRESVPKELDCELLLDARRQCRTLFGSCVQRARKTREEILKQTVSARLPMHVFVMGGARDVVFYRSSIEHMKKAQEKAGVPFFKDDGDIDTIGSVALSVNWGCGYVKGFCAC